MVITMHTNDTTLLQGIVTGMAMSANRHHHLVRVAMQVKHSDGLKAVVTMIERIPKTTSITLGTHNMTMSNTMNHGRHEVVGEVAQHFTCQTCLMVRSRQ